MDSQLHLSHSKTLSPVQPYLSFWIDRLSVLIFLSALCFSDMQTHTSGSIAGRSREYLLLHLYHYCGLVGSLRAFWSL